MIEWIKIIMTFVSGFITNGIIQFFVNRNDVKREKTRVILGEILQKLSDFGIALHEALDKWNENIHQISFLLDDHISLLKSYTEQLKSFNIERDRLLEKHKNCFCEHAPNCPNKISGPLPEELEKFFDSRIEADKKFEDARKLFEDNCLDILSEIIASISNYKGFLDKIPEAYTVPEKYFKIIYPSLCKIEAVNTEIIDRIHNMKAEPQYMLDKNNSLDKPLRVAIHFVESTKVLITQQISKV